MSTENTITTAEKDFAAAPNATLDELVGTTTNTALLPEPERTRMTKSPPVTPIR